MFDEAEVALRRSNIGLGVTQNDLEVHFLEFFIERSNTLSSLSRDFGGGLVVSSDALFVGF